MIFALLFVLYFVTIVCWGMAWQYGKGVVRADNGFVRTMTGIGLGLFLIAAFGMTIFSLAGTVTAIQNGFYL